MDSMAMLYWKSSGAPSVRSLNQASRVE